MGQYTFQNIRYPSDIQAHLSGKLKLNTSPDLRARDILSYAYVRNTTQRNGLVIDHIKTSTRDGEYESGLLVNNEYWFSDKGSEFMLPVELLFLSFRDNFVKPAIKINRELSPYSAPLEHFALIPGNVDPKTYGAPEEGYWPFKGYQDLGIDCLADIMAYCYKFRFNPETDSFEPLTDPLEITKALRRPYLELLLNGVMRDDLVSLQLRSVCGVLSRQLLLQGGKLTMSELNLLKAFSETPVSSESLNESGRTFDALMTAFESPQLLTDDGSNVYDDPLFSFYY